MAIANVALTDTFDTQRTRLNQAIARGNINEITIPAAFAQANTNAVSGTSAYNRANIANATAVSSFTLANSQTITIASAFTQANNAILAVVGAQSNATASFAQANIALGTTQGAFLQSNNQTTTIASAFGQANNAILAVVGAQSNATAAFAQANTVNVAVMGFYTASNDTINVTQTVVGNATSNVITTAEGLQIKGSFVSPVQSLRNKIINGNFDIWQRSNTTSTTGAFCADRFRTEAGGSTFVTSRQSFTLGQTDVPNEPKYYHRTVVTSSAGVGNLCNLVHPIESVRTFAGKSTTISFWAKADSSKNIAVELWQYFGSGGSPSSSVTAGVVTFALTTAWTKYTFTIDIPSIVGKALGSSENDYLGVIFWFDAGSSYNSRTNSLGQQSGTFDLSEIQYEEGSVATPFELRPIGLETLLCQRYCQRIGDSVSLLFPTSYGTSGSDGYCSVMLPVKMRAAPTTTKTGTWTVSNGGQPSFIASDQSVRVTQQITATGAAVSTAGSGMYIILSAEL